MTYNMSNDIYGFPTKIENSKYSKILLDDNQEVIIGVALNKNCPVELLDKLAKYKDLSILERLGHVSMVLNNKEEAAEYYSKILDFDATNTLAYEQLMDIYIDTDRYKYYIYRGNLHIVEHKLEHAINDYKKAVNSAQNDPEMLQARFVLGSLDFKILFIIHYKYNI